MKSSLLQNRSVHYDLLRIFASLAVICIHVCAESLTWESRDVSSSTWAYLNIFDSLSRISVPIFIMLSGSFIIDKYKENSLKNLYTKNIFRLVCSYIFWSCVYVVFNLTKDFIFHNPIDKKDLIYNLIQGEYHLWFIPMLIFLYAVTPLLKEICSTKKNEQYFVLLACIPVIFNFINYFITIKPLNVLFEHAGFQLVSGYTVYFILGHYLNRYEIQKKHRILIYILAVASAVLTIVGSSWHYISNKPGESYFFKYLSPNVFIFSIAIFLIFKHNFSKIHFGEKTKKLIVKLSSLTFGIYLSHIIFVKILKSSPLTIENIHPLISVPLLTLSIFILGAITTWIISKIPVLKKYII